MDQHELIPHLFRTEYRKIVSVMTKRFGLARIEVAEDITSETFLAAAQTWPMSGLPPNPVAWLYLVARNKAKNHLQREGVFHNKIAPELSSGTAVSFEDDIDLSPENISDSQLQMMFAICHPSISAEAQIGLSLRILCGFGIEEIADAFLTGREAIYKRLSRAREKLREENIQVEMPDNIQIEHRLENVLTTIYLLFNEGYYSLNQNETIRKDLCLEAMRLCTMLIENKMTDKPAVNALLALMCFHASRFDARVSETGDQILYDDQDESRWNAELVSRGGYYLHKATIGKTISKYHLEATIAYWNTQKKDTVEKWENILNLYDHLLEVNYSPIAALHRIFAMSKLNGKVVAIGEAEKLNLTWNPIYHVLLGELYTGIDSKKAKEYFQSALTQTRTDTARRTIMTKMLKL